jgi:phosphoserine phosphatase RsbU/P
MRILIAEDDVTSRIMLTELLKKKGHEVISTVDGTEAWDELQKDDAPSIAIIDWMMPDMDGLEVIKRVRAAEDALPVYCIMLTALSTKSDIVTALEMGADDYLVKPYDSGELWARVEVGSRIVNLQRRLATQIEELKEQAEHIKTLRGIVPICSWCKKIRNDTGYWQQVEVYVHENTEADFSHGICPDCVEKQFPDLLDGESDKTQAENQE